MSNSIPSRYSDLLLDNGYVLQEYDSFTIIKYKIVKSRAILIVFLSLSLPMIAIGFALLSINDNSFWAGGVIIILGLILGQVPFFPYLTAPYKSLLIHYKDRSLLFRSRFSRAYKFSEMREFAVTIDERYTDANPFSDTNIETTYNVDIHFSHNHKESLFRIVQRSEANDILMQEFVDYIERVVFKRMS